MHALILAGCAADLLPGEVVLGAEHPATFTYGPPNARLGAAVAWDGEGWSAAAPGEGTTWRNGESVDEPSIWVGWTGEAGVRVDADGQVWVEGEARWTAPGATAWAAGPEGVLAAGAGRLRHLDAGLDLSAPGIGRVAWGEGRILAVTCDPDCAARAWDLDGVELGEVAPAGLGGDVGEWGGLAWAGDPESGVDDGAGRVCAEDGGCLAGEPGDHLGIAIGGGFAAGTYNKWVVPSRARIVPLAGGTVLALEDGAEAQPLALSGDPATIVIGAPYHPAQGQPAGAVVVAGVP